MDLSKGLLLATTNKGKIEEIKKILQLDQSIKIYFPADIGLSGLQVEEHGKTFKENALIKAKAYAKHSGFVSLADDSGLEVEALDGAPGVESARYAGLGAGDKAIVDKLLKELKSVPIEKRRARFFCIVCVYDPLSDESIFAEGECTGHIAFEAKGSNGFGYDPIFIPDTYELTMAQLSPEIKNSISHRGRALRSLKEKLGV
jgi:XTP/dITP diphosphohydrolase